MDLGLKGKIALIVGENSNIGRAACVAFTKENADVAIANRGLDGSLP